MEPDAGESREYIVKGEIPLTEGVHVNFPDNMDIDVEPPSNAQSTAGPSPKPLPHPDEPIGEATKRHEGDDNSGHTEREDKDEGFRRMKLAEEKLAEENQREERRKAIVDQKQRELATLKSQVDDAKRRHGELLRKNEELTKEISRLNTQWDNAFRGLESQRQLLNASRSFAAREGTLDAATLIQAFNDLNASIGDFSFEVLRGLDENADSRPLQKDDYASLCDTVANYPDLKYFVENISGRDLHPSDLVDPVVAGILVSELMSTIFEPFVPGLDKSQSEILKRMYTKMRNSEPQERSARWRSITYANAVRSLESNFLQKAVNVSVSKVADVLTVLGGGGRVDLSEEYHSLAFGIFDAANKVQKRAKTEYVSFDYEVYTIPAKQRYDEKQMEASQAGTNKPFSEVWVTVGLGMKAMRRIQGEENSPTVEESIPVKPTVICNNWDNNA